MNSDPTHPLVEDEVNEEDFEQQSKPSIMVIRVNNTFITTGIMAAATVLSFLFRYIGFHESNIIMAYLLGVLLVAKQTEGFMYGIAASVIGVMTFNFFFTEPYYSFMTHRPDYPVTFLIMLIVAVITSALTTKAKQEAKRSSLREKRTLIQYRISKSLLQARSMNQIAEVSVRDIAKLFNRSVALSTAPKPDSLSEPIIYAFKQDEHSAIFRSFPESQARSEALRTGQPTGAGTEAFPESSAFYLPIRGQSGIIGVVGVSCFGHKPLSGDQQTLLEAVTTQIALAMERERLLEKQQNSKLEVERERLRGNLLRSMSHDLRTPLTGILGATATILDNNDVLDRQVRDQLLQGIYEDANWLIHSIENILSLTRIDEGKVEIKKSMEAVEEIVAEAVSRMKRVASSHTIQIRIPADLVMLPVDGLLIEQVLVNLLDNAIKYTPSGSIIELRAEALPDSVVFEVADNGNGIAEEFLPSIFKRFYTTATLHNTGRRGTGLGLAICKSIVTAHGGDITAFNNASGGATFRFELPR